MIATTWIPPFQWTLLRYLWFQPHHRHVCNPDITDSRNFAPTSRTFTCDVNQVCDWIRTAITSTTAFDCLCTNIIETSWGRGHCLIKSLKSRKNGAIWVYSPQQLKGTKWWKLCSSACNKERRPSRICSEHLRDNITVVTAAKANGNALSMHQKKINMTFSLSCLLSHVMEWH